MVFPISFKSFKKHHIVYDNFKSWYNFMASTALQEKRERKKELYAKMNDTGLTDNPNIDRINTTDSLSAEIVTKATPIIEQGLEETVSAPDPTTGETTSTPTYPNWDTKRAELEALLTDLNSVKSSINTNNARFKKHTDTNSGVIDPDFDDPESPAGLATTLSIATAIKSFYKEVEEPNPVDWKVETLGSVFETNQGVLDFYTNTTTDLTNAITFLDNFVFEDTIENVELFLSELTPLTSINASILTTTADSEIASFNEASRVLQKNLMLELVISNKEQFGNILKEGV